MVNKTPMWYFYISYNNNKEIVNSIKRQLHLCALVVTQNIFQRCNGMLTDIIPQTFQRVPINLISPSPLHIFRKSDLEPFFRVYWFVAIRNLQIIWRKEYLKTKCQHFD